MTLKTFCKKQLNVDNYGDTPEADFCKDALRDNIPNFKSWDEMKTHLQIRGACPDAITAGREVWKDFKEYRNSKQTDPIVDIGSPNRLTKG